MKGLEARQTTDSSLLVGEISGWNWQALSRKGLTSLITKLPQNLIKFIKT